MISPDRYDVIVIGGGASGMMAAGTAAARGKKVLLLEKNDALGKKLNITGGGRCNLTNNSSPNDRAFLAHYDAAGKYLFSPFSQHSVADSIAFFESRGLKCKTEEGGRVFPVSDKATDVTRVVEEYMREGHVTVNTGESVQSLAKEDGRIKSVTTTQGTYAASAVVIATGGLSHPYTGSTGDGFAWLRELGHAVQAPDAALVPLRTSDTWTHALSGVTIPHMKITFFADRKRSFSKTGRLLFTHFGLSGPLIINSAKDVRELIAANAEVTATIDLFPDMHEVAVDERVLGAIDMHKNKLMRNVLAEIVPPRLAEGVEVLAGVDPEIKAHSFTADARKKLVRTLKNLPVHIEGLMGIEHAIVSDGGVILDEVDTRTMRSRVIENLYLTGDILNVNRPSGRYSLQLCWTTGYVAGMHA